MLECNFFTILLKPNYEKAVDTAEDVIDRGLNVLWIPGAESELENMKNAPSRIHRELAEMYQEEEATTIDPNINILNYLIYFNKEYK